MTATAQPTGSVWSVELSDLVCPGCGGSVVDAPPSGWSARAGRSPDFSHPDGSVLCPDSSGRVPEPVEARGVAR